MKDLRRLLKNCNLCLKSLLNGLLQEMLNRTSKRICLTTNTWTSCQNLCYMCLTAHFVDNGWNLQKRILNFCKVPNHKGDTLGRAIEACLLDWGIDRILCITVDNASSNDTAITYLKKCVNGWGNAILESKHLHMRCGAHILNLIVEQGLKEYNISINRIRVVVRYVRGSPIRL